MNACPNVCKNITDTLGAYRGQKRAADLLELE